MATYEYNKTYSSDLAGLQSQISASLSGLVGITWDEEPRTGHDGNLDIQFSADLSAEDKSTLDSIVAAFGA